MSFERAGPPPASLSFDVFGRELSFPVLSRPTSLGNWDCGARSHGRRLPCPRPGQPALAHSLVESRIEKGPIRSDIFPSRHCLSFAVERRPPRPAYTACSPSAAPLEESVPVPPRNNAHEGSLGRHRCPYTRERLCAEGLNRQDARDRECHWCLVGIDRRFSRRPSDSA